MVKESWKNYNTCSGISESEQFRSALKKVKQKVVAWVGVCLRNWVKYLKDAKGIIDDIVDKIGVDVFNETKFLFSINWNKRK